MRVFIMRHSTAVDPYAAPDEFRWLTEAGRARVRAMTQAVGDELGVPTHIFTSPLVRAVQTADLLAEGLGFEGIVKVHAPLAIERGTTAQALSVLDELDDRAKVFLVSHEPKVRVLLGHLAGISHAPSFRTGSIAAVDMHSKSGRGHFAFWVNPDPAEIQTPSAV